MQYKESTYNVRVPLRGERALWYNSMSRALVVVDAAKVALRRRLWSDDHFASEPDLSSLLSQGFLVPEDLDEKELLKKQYFDTRNDPSAVNFIVCPTLSCNFGCDYCFQGVDKPLEAMSPAVQDRVIALYERMIQDVPGLNFINMIWYGGEPLMRKQIIYDLADRLMDISALAGIRYTGTMVSNGFLMTRRWPSGCSSTACARCRSPWTAASPSTTPAATCFPSPRRAPTSASCRTSPRGSTRCRSRSTCG
jgi:uncharacterized protein